MRIRCISAVSLCLFIAGLSGYSDGVPLEKTFNSIPYPNSNGVDFDMKYPSHWEVIPGDNDIVVCHFLAPDPGVRKMITITSNVPVESDGFGMTKSAQLRSLRKAPQELTEKGFKILDTVYFDIGPIPALSLHYEAEGKMTGQPNGLIQGRQVYFWVGPHSISISFKAIGTVENRTEVERSGAEIESLSDAMVESVRVNNLDSFPTRSPFMGLFHKVAERAGVGVFAGLIVGILIVAIRTITKRNKQAPPGPQATA
jgi:hypothetical protein